MTSEEFWKDDPQLFVSYRTSFINKKKREKEEKDYICWLQGLYIHQGNGLIIGSLKQFIGNMFSKSKDQTNLGTYPKKPYTELEKDEINKNKEQKAKNSNKYNEFQNSLVYFGTLKQQFLDRQRQKKGEWINGKSRNKH